MLWVPDSRSKFGVLNEYVPTLFCDYSWNIAERGWKLNQQQNHIYVLNIYMVPVQLSFLKPRDLYHWSDSRPNLLPALEQKLCIGFTCWRFAFFGVLGAAVAEWLSSLLAGQEDRGSIPGLATWIFRDWLSPASKSRYGWNTTKATQILNTTNPNLRRP